MHRIAWPGCVHALCNYLHRRVAIHTPGHPTRPEQSHLATPAPRRSQAITALGALKSPKGVVRSHVVIRKGGEVASLRVKISPGDSVAEGLETILEIAAK